MNILYISARISFKRCTYIFPLKKQRRSEILLSQMSRRARARPWTIQIFARAFIKRNIGAGAQYFAFQRVNSRAAYTHTHVERETVNAESVYLIFHKYVFQGRLIYSRLKTRNGFCIYPLQQQPSPSSLSFPLVLCVFVISVNNSG